MSSYYNKALKLLTPITKLISRNYAEGIHNIPAHGGVIIAPNHISNIDPVLLGVKIASYRPVYALAKESLFRVPLIGKMLKKMGHIPVHRGSTAAGGSLKAAKQRLQQGEAVAIYPEGTIPKDGSGKLGPFKTGVARLAKETAVPVIPVGQWGAQHVLPLSQNPLMSVLKAVKARPFQVAVVGEPLRLQDFSSTETFMSELRAQIETLSEQARRIAKSKELR